MSSRARPTASDVAELLQERVLSGVIEAGAWLRQEQLAEELGVSRTPVREALRMLDAIGVVEVVPHRGALVRGPSVREVRESYEVRAELEGFAAALAARWMSDEHVATMERAQQLFERAATAGSVASKAPAEGAEWGRANDLFHGAILDGSGNKRLQETVRTLHRSLPRNLTWSVLSGNRHLLRENVLQHRAVATALVARDTVAARESMTVHVARAGELVVMRYEQLLAERNRFG